MKLFTIGYGGRTQEEFLRLLHKNHVCTVVDVRLRPDRASMGIWVKARTSDKGIEKILSDAGIGYRSLVELGNIFLDFEDWSKRYENLLDQAGELLVRRLFDIPEPLCLLCAEKRFRECHRWSIGDYMLRKYGVEVEHLE